MCKSNEDIEVTIDISKLRMKFTAVLHVVKRVKVEISNGSRVSQVFKFESSFFLGVFNLLGFLEASYWERGEVLLYLQLPFNLLLLKFFSLIDAQFYFINFIL